jgi:hypothetical protein
VLTSLLIGSAELSDVLTSLTYPFPRRSPECAIGLSECSGFPIPDTSSRVTSGALCCGCEARFMGDLSGELLPRLNPQEPLHGGRQFRYLIVGLLPIPDGFPDAMLDVVLEQDDRDLL